MSIPLVIWCSTAALLIAIILANFFRHAFSPRTRHLRHRVIEFGSEREEIYVPGDKRQIENHDYEDIDDL